MFWICSIVVIICLQRWKGSENTEKAKRLSHEEIKKQLIESIVINDTIETDELNKTAEEVQKPREATAFIKQYE